MSEAKITEKSTAAIAGDTAKAVGKVVGVSALATVTVLAVLALVFLFMVSHFLHL